jgi:hypothetical protein
MEHNDDPSSTLGHKDSPTQTAKNGNGSLLNRYRLTIFKGSGNSFEANWVNDVKRQRV